VIVLIAASVHLCVFLRDVPSEHLSCESFFFVYSSDRDVVREPMLASVLRMMKWAKCDDEATLPAIGIESVLISFV
jgi:hypothetical protein